MTEPAEGFTGEAAARSNILLAEVNNGSGTVSESRACAENWLRRSPLGKLRSWGESCLGAVTFDVLDVTEG